MLPDLQVHPAVAEGVVTPDRTGQVWSDLDLGQLVTIYVYGPPELQRHGDYKHPVIVLEQGRAELWGAGGWETDNCMRRLL